MLEPVVIGQDEQTELHVQAVIQSGRRQLDIRIWRRGPTGFAPSRRALTLEASDVDALREGIGELLEASSGGRQVARVVWDKDEGRRLRAETEPFGTRYVARLGFWQRVRDTWRQADDGLVLAAEHLKPLLDVLDALRPRLLAPDDDAFGGTLSSGAHIGLQSASQRWPTPGADWLTIEPDRLALHPRGVRITATVEEIDGAHRIALRQWRRDESLWLPEDAVLLVGVLDLESLLYRLRDMADGKKEDEQTSEQGEETDPLPLRVSIKEEGDTRALLIEERLSPPDDYRFEPRLSLPVEYLPRLGRMLAQAGMMLIKRLSHEERAELQSIQGPEIAPAIVDDALGMPEDLAETNEVAVVDQQSHAEPEESGAAYSRHDSAGNPTAPDPPFTRDQEEDSEPARRLTSLGEIRLGRFLVFLYLQEEQDRELAFLWDGYALNVPLDEVQHMLTDVRDLYYDSIRGRRGQALTAGAGSSIRMSVHNQGSATSLVLEQETNGKQSRLSFPVNDVPNFLNAATAAMKKVGNHGT